MPAETHSFADKTKKIEEALIRIEGELDRLRQLLAAQKEPISLDATEQATDPNTPPSEKL